LGNGSPVGGNRVMYIEPVGPSAAQAAVETVEQYFYQ